MRNFIFISPNFPSNYWKFCKELQNDGFNVLGIGDCPYDALTDDMRNSVNEYYWVTNLENYDEVYRAVAFFAFKYGKIEYLESNNEYWLERDATLRSEFNIKTGFLAKDVKKIKYKSAMKRYFAKADIKVAKHCLVKSLNGCKKFVEEVGYPVIVKPDNGVGASDTHKISNDIELAGFFMNKPAIQYIMEQFIEGEVNSYDAIIDGEGNPVFETGNVTPDSLMDVVNNKSDSIFYILNEPHDDIKAAGRMAVAAFGVKNRFVHIEFFRLTKDQKAGNKGDILGLEVNMRPSGGISPDMFNYANSTDVYKIWADTLAFGKSELKCGEKFYCAFAGRRNEKEYALSEADVKEKYAQELKLAENVPDVLSGAMGDTMFVAAFKTKKAMNEFYSEVLAVK